VTVDGTVGTPVGTVVGTPVGTVVGTPVGGTVVGRPVGGTGVGACALPPSDGEARTSWNNEHLLNELTNGLVMLAMVYDEQLSEQAVSEHLYLYW